MSSQQNFCRCFRAYFFAFISSVLPVVRRMTIYARLCFVYVTVLNVSQRHFYTQHMQFRVPLWRGSLFGESRSSSCRHLPFCRSYLHVIVGLLSFCPFISFWIHVFVSRCLFGTFSCSAFVHALPRLFNLVFYLTFLYFNSLHMYVLLVSFLSFVSHIQHATISGCHVLIVLWTHSHTHIFIACICVSGKVFALFSLSRSFHVLELSWHFHVLCGSSHDCRSLDIRLYAAYGTAAAALIFSRQPPSAVGVSLPSVSSG